MQKNNLAFFTSVDDEWFTGNDAARGPWSADACHAGPVTGLLARAFERAIDDKQLARITADYIRPVPMAGFRIDTEIVRSGRAATNCRATLIGRKVDGSPHPSRSASTTVDYRIECDETPQAMALATGADALDCAATEWGPFAGTGTVTLADEPDASVTLRACLRDEARNSVGNVTAL